MTFHSRTLLPVYHTLELRRIEAAASGALAPCELMERAGLAAAHIARDIGAGGRRRVLVAAGPGNNGGDAFVVARHLKAWSFDVEVVFTGDAERLSADAQAALRAWRACGGDTHANLPADPRWGLVVDGLFGIGLTRDLHGEYAELIAAINRMDARVLALDVPSGLDSDTGCVRGCAVRADHTATFIGLKAGLLTLDGPDHCGEIHLCTLDIDSAPAPAVRGAVIGSDIMRTVLPARRANSHKGDYGSLGIIGGAHGMAGAALLAARAALQLGTGRVYVGLIDGERAAYDPAQPELMLRAAHDILRLDHLSALAIGPGLGQSPDAHHLLESAARQNVPLVIDADALNLIAADPALQQLVAARAAPTFLTPHPAEAARLLARETSAVQADRITAACEIAARYRSAIVLKGAGSVCALADGTWFINTSGNPGMASAGMGDVLTGLIAALLAQGADAKNALLAGVHLHGAAGDALAAARGSVGITASDCITAARNVFNRAQSCSG
jgi:hydroxyethylthiazole kinase-like uncharacterized protein yjeF